MNTNDVVLTTVKRGGPARDRSKSERPDRRSSGKDNSMEVMETATVPKTDHSTPATVTLFTIGFTKTDAQTFFKKLQNAGVKRVIDVRLNNTGQMSGFTKKRDLPYFLRTIANIDYVHFVDLAPTEDIFDRFKNKQMDWSEYEELFNQLLQQRRPEEHYRPEDFDRACLLCSEPMAENCHRRLVAEHLRRKWGNVVIKHL